MNHYYSDYNIIPIGDHCAVSIMFKELGLRNKSYPFDWNAHIDPLYNRVSTPEEYAQTKRWITYYDNPNHSGRPVRI